LITNIHLTNGFLSDTKALLIPGVRPTAKGVSSAVSIRKIYWDATLKLHLLDSVVIVSLPDPIPKVSTSQGSGVNTEAQTVVFDGKVVVRSTEGSIS